MSDITVKGVSAVKGNTLRVLVKFLDDRAKWLSVIIGADQDPKETRSMFISMMKRDKKLPLLPFVITPGVSIELVRDVEAFSHRAKVTAVNLPSAHYADTAVHKSKFHN